MMATLCHAAPCSTPHDRAAFRGLFYIFSKAFFHGFMAMIHFFGQSIDRYDFFSFHGDPRLIDNFYFFWGLPAGTPDGFNFFFFGGLLAGTPDR